MNNEQLENDIKVLKNILENHKDEIQIYKVMERVVKYLEELHKYRTYEQKMNDWLDILTPWTTPPGKCVGVCRDYKKRESCLILFFIIKNTEL